MRPVHTLACLSLASLVMTAACTGPDGYYDSRGGWHESTRYSSPSKDGKNFYTDHSARKGDSAGVIGYDRNRDETLDTVQEYPADDVTIVYKRSGYYDYEGNYYQRIAKMPVPRNYFPPRGMCRVWLEGVAPVDQPAIESCTGIQYRVPAGSYVIYGG